MGWVPLKAEAPSLDIDRLASEEGADPALVRAVMGAESSGGKDTRTSPDGAMGHMQIIPATFKRFAKPGEAIDNPEHNVRVGARYLKFLSDRVGGDPFKIGAAYLSGEGNVDQWGIVNDDVKDAHGTRPSMHGKKIADAYRRLAGEGGEGSGGGGGGGSEQIKPSMFMLDRPEAVKPQQDIGVMGAAGRGITHGMIGLAESVNLGGQFLAGRMGAQGAQEFFKAGADWWSQLGEGYAPPPELQGNILDKPELLGKGAWWAYSVADMVPSVASTMVPALGTYSAMIKGPAAIARLARIGAAVTGGAVGGAQEGLQTYKTVLERGGSDGEAAVAGTLMGLASAGLNALSLDVLMGKSTAPLKKFLLSGATESLTEWAEEPAEGAILSGTTVAKPEDDPLTRLREGANVVPPSFLLGGLGGMGGGARKETAAPPAPGKPPAGGAPGGLPSNVNDVLGGQPGEPPPPGPGTPPADPGLVAPTVNVTGTPPEDINAPAAPLGGPSLWPAPAGVRSNRLGRYDSPENRPSESGADTGSSPFSPLSPSGGGGAHFQGADGNQYRVEAITPELFDEFIRPDMRDKNVRNWEEYHAKYPSITHMRLKSDDGINWRPSSAPFVGGAERLLQSTPVQTAMPILPDDAAIPGEAPITTPQAEDAVAPAENAIAPPDPVQTSPNDVQSDVQTPPPSIDDQAQEAATSQANDIPEPTEAQQQAGNYKKGHVKLHGLDISIENPRGSVRSGTDEDGKAWESVMQSHYGYIRRTEGADGDHIDTFIGPNPDSEQVFVVDQINPKTGAFDEHKVMLGFDSQEEAESAYRANFDPDWKGMGAVTPMSAEEFRTWLKDGDVKGPVSKSVTKETKETKETSETGETGAESDKSQSRHDNSDDEPKAPPPEKPDDTPPETPADAGVSASGEADPSPLTKARNDLIELLSQEKAQGQVVDDRLLDRIRRQKKLIADMEREESAPASGEPEVIDAEKMTRAEALTALTEGKRLLRYGTVKWIEEVNVGKKAQTYVVKDKEVGGSVVWTKGPVGEALKWGWAKIDAANKAIEAWDFAVEKKPEPKSDHPPLNLIQTSTGRWVFVGKVPDEVYYVEGATPDEIRKGKQFGERFGPKKRVFDTKEEAIAHAESFGYSVIPPDELKKPEPPKAPKQVSGYGGHSDRFADHEKELAGRVVYSHGDIALLEGFSVLDGMPVYVGLKGSSRTRIDIDSFTGKLFTADELAELQRAKAAHVAEQDRLHKGHPNGPFKSGVQVAWSDGISEELAHVARGWIEMLGIKARVFIVKSADVRADHAAVEHNLYGPFAAIRSAGLQAEHDGSARRLSNGDFYISLPSGRRTSGSLEVLAHEIGHILEKTEWASADAHTRTAVMAAYNRWLFDQGKPTAKDWVFGMRAHTTAKMTIVNAEQPSSALPGYWKSFSEFFADQVSRWATSSEKPLTVVDKWFAKIAKALRRLYASVAGKPWLPNAEMKAYLDGRTEAQPSVTPEPAGASKADLSAMFDDVLAEEVAKDEKPIATGWDRLEIVPTGFDDGSYIVRDADARQDGSYQKYARFNLNDKGRAVKVEHFYEHSRAHVKDAIDRWVSEQPSAAATPKPRAKAKKAETPKWVAALGVKVGDRFNFNMPQSYATGEMSITSFSSDSIEVREANGAGTFLKRWEFERGMKDGAITPIAAPEKPAPRTATESATSAAKNTAAGLNAAIDGLGALFGGKGRLGSGPLFDEETYAKAKPLFQQAIAHFHAAGTDLKEAMRAVIRMVLDRFGGDAANAMKPYVVRFMEDVRDGNISTNAEGTGNERGSDAGEGTGPLDEVAPEQGGGTESVGDAGRDAAGGGDRGAEDDPGPDGAGVSAPRGGRGGAQGPRAPKAGGGRGRRGLGAKGTGGSGSSVSQRDEGAVAAPNIPATNYRITEDVRLGEGGEGEKFRDNLAAIRILKDLEREQRRATADEQRALARYVGWGGLKNAFSDDEGNFKSDWEARGKDLADLLTPAELKAARRSTRNAHYTSKTIVDAMWQAVRRLGFRGGMALESSMGTGNFLGLVPDEIAGQTHFVGVEYDSLTSRIARALYPQSTVLHTGFHKLPLPDGEFDLNIGNPPFGSESLRFQYNPGVTGKSIHNQFFLAGMDTLRPGGIQAMVVSRYMLDTQDRGTRFEMAKKARLLGAVRLPDTAFKENARTEVVTDILFFQKFTADEAAAMKKIIDAANSSPLKDQTKERERQALAGQMPEWIDTEEVRDPLGGDPIRVNAYFARRPTMMMGTLERSGKMRQAEDVTVRLEKGADLAAMLKRALDTLPKGVMTQTPDALAQAAERFKTMSDALGIAVSGLEPGGIVLEGDTLSQVVERETPSGEYEMSKRTLSPEAPWSPNLYLDERGRWFSLEVELDEDGNPKKLVKNGKATKLNAYVRKVYETEADVPATMRLGETRYNRIRAMVGLRDLLKNQLVLEAEDAKKADMERNRGKLSAAYDAFVKDHGFVNDPSNAVLVSEMPDGALVLALETAYVPEITAKRAKTLGESPRAASATKAPILSRRVVEPYHPPSQASTPADALVISLSESGRVDLERIAALLGVDEETAAQKLQEGEKPLAYLDPETKTWETRDAYLSGEVRRKLSAARFASMDLNVRALEEVQPEPWGAENVTAILGSTWVPSDVYEGFIEHLTGERGSVQFSRLTNGFQVRAPSTQQGQEWKTDDATLQYLLEKKLNSSAIRITYTDSDGKTHFMAEQTAEAQLKAKQIESEFQNWVFEDSARRDRLVQLFNDRFNTRVLRQFDGSHLILPGKVPDQIIRMRRHQMNAIWRGISQRFMLLDHVVGAGKTFTAIARAMERRRMGLSRKPTIVVPNHLVEQFAADTYRLYPGAKVLAATKKDFEKQRRRRLFAKIATGDWDLVIIPHSSFRFIGIAPETEERFLEEELRLAKAAIKEAEEAADEAGLTSGWRKPFNVKEAERLAETIEQRMDKLKARKADRLLTFEQMGIDDMTVDEAHEFKNLFYSSRLTGVRGMNDKTGSQKAFDLYNKIRVLRESPTGTVTFMTGTPISNSAVEMYTMMRYLAANELRDLGLEHFDAWRAQFVDTSTKWEPTESGRLKEVNRLGRTWSNMRSLMDLYYSITDAVSIDDIKRWFKEDNAGRDFPVPKVKDGGRRSVVVKPTPAQQSMLETILEGFDRLESITDVKARNAARLRLMDRARKVSLDVRAVHRGHPSKEEGGKLEAASDEIARIYKAWEKDRGTQLVFLDRSTPLGKGDDKVLKQYDKLVADRDQALAANDEEAYRELTEKLDEFDANEMEAVREAMGGGWNAYEQIKQNLIARGIPANEIRFIHEANTDAQKQAIFDAMNGGEIRVLLGSTPRLGAGTNVQKRLVALHHIDVTWKPSDIEQREGRIIRQGNLLLEQYGPDFEVEILAYATERTVDAKMWDLNSTKLKTINGIRNYEGQFTMDFLDDDSVSMAEMAALASGDPMLMERVKLMSEIEQLDLLERIHRRKVMGARSKREWAERTLRETPDRITETNEVSALVSDALGGIEKRGAERSININGTVHATAFNAMKAALELIAEQRGEDEKGPWSLMVNGAKVTNKATLEQTITNVLGDAEAFEGEFGGASYIRRNPMAGDIADQITNRMRSASFKTGGPEEVIGKFLGFDLVLHPLGKLSVELMAVDPKGRDLGSWRVFAEEDASKGEPPTVNAGVVRTALKNIESSIRWKKSSNEAYLRGQIAEAEAELPKYREQEKAPFEHAEAKAAKVARLEEVIKGLAGKGAKPADFDYLERMATSFARGDRPTRTLPVKDIEAAIAPIRRVGKGLPPTMVVQSQRQLPDGLQRVIEDSGSFVKAAYHEGSIYIIADHVESTDEASYLMLHEAAHYGLEGIFGRELAAVMMKIWNDNTTIREKAAAFRAEHGVSQAKAVEEILAEMAADGEKATALQRFVAWVRDWFRRRGVQVKMSEGDILAILSRAQGYWKRPPKWTHLYTSQFADGGPRGWGEVEGGPVGAQNAIPTEVIADDTAATVFESIRAGFVKRGLGELPAGALVRVAPQLDRLSDADALRGRDIRGAERIAQVFGHEVVWFENNAPEVRDFGGVVSSLDPKRIYINVRGYKPHLNVVGHELLHRMRAERPDLYDRFLKAVTPLLQNTDNHQHPFAVGDDKQLEELLADFSGWNFMRRGFWREMAARDRSAFGKIADYILSFLDDLVLKMSRFVGDRSVYFSDVKAEQAALADVMAEFKAGKAPMTTETLQFIAEATGRPPGTTEAQFATNAPPSEGRFTSSYGNQARRAIDWIDAKLDPIGLLPGKAEYLAKRYATLGRIARLEEVSKELHKIFGQASDEDQQAAYRFFLTPNGDPNMIPGSAAREAAVRAKSLIESVGDALVSRDMMSPEAREAHRGRYLPQVYLKFLLGDQNWKMLGSGKKVSDRGYLKNRKLDRIIGDDGEVHVVDAVTRQPVDEEFLNAMLGPVKDPGFLASMAIVKPSRDMAILDFLEQISEHEDWVLPHSTIEWRGRRVSVHWAKKEAERLRRQARHMDDPEASTARTYAEELDTLADEGLGKVTQHPDYRQIPDTSRYGRLRGIYVRKEIYDDLMGVNDFLPEDPGWFQSLFGYGGIGSKVTALWKAGKVSLNPPAQIRNAVSNFVLLQLSGVSLLKAPGRVMQAWKEIANGGVHWEIAKKFGVTESTWSSQELFRMRRDLLEIEQRAGHLKAWGKVKLLSAAMMDFAGDKYQFMEALFKTAKIIDEKARGKSDADAAIEAQRWLFDYSLVPKSVRYARSAPIGMPFLTFAYKVLPRLIEVATLHPQRFLPWVALAYGLPMLVAQAWDVDDDDIEQLKMAMPEWLRDRGHAYILPYKDEHDRWQVLDLGYFFPWTTWTEPLRNMAEGEVGKAAQGLGLFSGPITDLIVANATGKDSFTGRDIVQKGDPPQRQFLSIMNYLWSMAAPPIVTDYGAAGHALRAATGTTNRYGDPLSSAGQAALRAIGINVYALNPEQERAKAVKRMVHEVEDTMLRLKTRLSDRGLSQSDRDDIVAEYVEEMKRRQQKIRDYLEESEIHPNLGTGAQ